MKIAWIAYFTSKTNQPPLAGRHPFLTSIQIQSSHLKTAWIFITNALAKMQLKSCRDHTVAELLDNLREVANIDDLPFQHGTPLETERETGSGGTVLADYESDLESFSPERLVPVIIQQPGGAPS